MNKIFFLILLFLSGSSLAQVNFGPKVGINLSTVHSSADNDFSPHVNFIAGLLFEMNVNDQWKVCPEILISKKGYNFILIPSGTTTNALTYLSIPVLASYHLTETVFFKLGPEINFLIAARTKNNNFNKNISSEFYGYDFALAGGGGYKIAGRYCIEARYLLGLSQISRNTCNFGKLNNRTIQLDLVYLLKR